jgi:hypothetical protein
MMKIFVLICIVWGSIESQNLITKSNFNFGHQLGNIYSRNDSAYCAEAGSWTFSTGFYCYYTPDMPLVTNPYWIERTMFLVPISFEVFPTNKISLQIDLTDLFIEFPYKDIHNMGGKSPRFMTKMVLLTEKKYFPATALTVGVKFSSAKPYNIWDSTHNYDSSNGLAGAGTGETDYLILFTMSKRILSKTTLHARIGLAPLGSPVEYTRGSGQADEIPYGITAEQKIGDKTRLSLGIMGMKNGLESTKLAHYSVLRINSDYSLTPKTEIGINLEKGLTKESDSYVAGFLIKWHFRKSDKRSL